ncbi:hypothetical protein [Methylosinus sp. Sm6]|uniref:hypothetical protein n=1 Tax=Methylosinus sp. Sm6 TaxID=2866948 RepID=UPI001C997A56|nr:hypothetical protein [Methylosinus sp. Sm6]MBY6243152.1 hypothetical protein [Methylosinus sp. Sm6]
MTPYSIMILICSLSVAPSDCRPETAIDVVQGPKVSNIQQCGLMGQSTIAGVAIAPRDGEEYMKIVCRRPA